MAFVKSNSYRDISFSAETPLNDFYTYIDIKELAHKCDMIKHEVKKCRTIGILQSSNGRFLLSDIDEALSDTELIVQVSVIYLKSPPQSTVIPYPVQVFGMLQWKNKPVIFAMIMQAMTVPMAIKLKNALSGITSLHLARQSFNFQLEDTDMEDFT